MGYNSVFKRLIATLNKANKQLDLRESKQKNEHNQNKAFLPSSDLLFTYVLFTYVPFVSQNS